MNEAEVLEVIEANAVRIASLYKARCWWASHEDMAQEARRAQLEAYRKGGYDEAFGGGVRRYLWAAGWMAVQRVLHKASAPVSTSHRTSNLIGLRRVPTAYTVGEVVVENPELPTLDGEAAAIAEDRRRRVQERVVALLGPEAAEFALGVMTHEWAPREVAEAHGVPVATVYAVQSRLRNILIGDRALYELWRD